MTGKLFSQEYPLLSLWASDDEEDHAKYRSLSKQYSSLLKTSSAVVAKGTVYLNGMLHDSWVTSVEHEDREIRIWLNEFSTHCFADAYAQAYGINVPHERRVLPVCLRFTGLTRCQIYWTWNSGEMVPLRTERHLRHLSELLMDEVTAMENGRISTGFLFWSRKKHPKEQRRLILQLHAERLDIEEHNARAFVELFGASHVGAFDRFWVQRQAGRYFDYSSAMSFLKESK